VIRQALLALAFAAAGATPAAAGFLESVPGQVVDLPTRAGVTDRYVAFAPDQAPVAAALLFTGGEGVLTIKDHVGPTWGQTGNFLVRIRENLRRRGIYVAVIDVPSDHSYGYGLYRTSAGHAEDVAAVIADLRKRTPGVPLWLIGTSMGTISAANAASRLHGGSGPDGIVLTSVVTRIDLNPKGSFHSAIYDVDLSAVHVPTLVTFHRSDNCDAVSTVDGSRILAKLENAPRKDLMLFEGGDPPQSKPCEALAAHGYYGIEAKVADAIADWMLAGH